MKFCIKNFASNFEKTLAKQLYWKSPALLQWFSTLAKKVCRWLEVLNNDKCLFRNGRDSSVCCDKIELKMVERYICFDQSILVSSWTSWFNTFSCFKNKTQTNAGNLLEMLVAFSLSLATKMRGLARWLWIVDITTQRTATNLIFGYSRLFGVLRT